MKKILLITGMHPNEKYSKTVCLKTQEHLYDFNIDIFDIGFEGSERNVSFNLNRAVDREKLQGLYHKLNELNDILQSKYYDLVLDVHNSSDLCNCILYSMTDNTKLLSKKFNEYTNFLISNTVYRKTSFQSLATEYREFTHSKTFTIEINGMQDKPAVYDDVIFLSNCIKGLIHDDVLVETNALQTSENYISLLQNKLYTIQFELHDDILENYIGQIFTVNVKDILETDIDITDLQEIKIKHICGDITYTDQKNIAVFECIVVKNDK